MSLHVYLPSLAMGDRDNYLKLVQDALQGVVWANDRQCISGPTEVRVSRHNPRTVVRVERFTGEIEEAV
jgi:Holliday junction resolvase RusA-like endonuclease